MNSTFIANLVTLSGTVTALVAMFLAMRNARLARQQMEAARQQVEAETDSVTVTSALGLVIALNGRIETLGRDNFTNAQEVTALKLILANVREEVSAQAQTLENVDRQLARLQLAFVININFIEMLDETPPVTVRDLGSMSDHELERIAETMSEKVKAKAKKDEEN